MKKDKKRRRIGLIIVGLVLVTLVIVAGGIASAFAYWQISDSPATITSYLNRERRENRGVIVHIDNEQGVLITTVDPDGPAARAGMRQGTVVLAVNGVNVNSPRELVEEINQYDAGDSITLSIIDGDAKQDVEVTLESAGPYLGLTVGGDHASFDRFNFDMDVLPRFRGFDGFEGHFDLPQGRMPWQVHPFAPLDDLEDFEGFEHLERYGEYRGFGDVDGFDNLEHFFSGATVWSVVPSAPAEEAGIQSGDIIIAVEGDDVNGQDGLQELLARFEPGDEVDIDVQRDSETVSIVISLSSHPDDPERSYLGVTLLPAPQLPKSLFRERRRS